MMMDWSVFVQSAAPSTMMLLHSTTPFGDSHNISMCKM